MPSPVPAATTGLPSARLFEAHDLLTLALDATERPGGYDQSEREARSYTRAALRQVNKLIEVQAC